MGASLRSTALAAAVAAGLLSSLVALVLAAGATPHAGAAGPASTPALVHLSTPQLIGQHMVYAYGGRHAPAALVQRIGRGEVAGVILFKRNIGSRAALRAEVARLQAVPRPRGLGAPLLVMIDQEGGLVKRLSGAPRHSPAALGRIGSIRLAGDEGAATARNLRGVGISVNLAPVLDVARSGSFQERVGRSYGRDPARVGALGAAFAAGLQGAGVAATAKHFPGIGLPRVDEDTVASRIGLSRARLRSIDELPFATAIRARIDMVMLSTAVYPAFSSVPAMFSRRLAVSELRGRLGFAGVSITDDLETDAAAAYGSVQRRGLMSARAGADLLLFAQSYAGAARAASGLVRDVRAGRVARSDLRASASRVLRLRASLGS